MSEHICPRCGYKFEDKSLDILPDNHIYDKWQYVDIFDGYLICGHCNEAFNQGYVKIDKPDEVEPLSIRRNRYFLCTKCANDFDILGD